VKRETKLKLSDFPRHLRAPSYSGRSYRVVIASEITLPSDRGISSGGSRETFELVRLEDGASVGDPATKLAPWSPERSDVTVPLAPGFIVRQHSRFCGKDCGITFIVHPSDVARVVTSGVRTQEVLPCSL
jgi:hypothetical protein